MQTVLQTLLEKIDERISNVESLASTTNNEKIVLTTVLKVIKSDAQEFMENEKQQIYNAFNEGYRQGFNDGNSWSENEKDISEYDDAKNYYNNNYENDEKFCVCKNPTLGSSISKCGTCGEWFKTVH